MQKKYLLALVAVTLLIAASGVFSPHWTVHRMRVAIEARDEAAFSSYVDYPAVRESFKQQLAQRGPDRDKQTGQDPFAALGEGLVRAVTGPVIDLLLGPAGLIEMLNAGRPEVTSEVMSAAVSRVPSSAQAVPEMTLRYRDWETVVYRRADATDADGSFIFQRQDWLRWRLSAVELPR